MSELFGGLGRTWLMAVIVIIGVTVLFAMGKVQADQWKSIVQWVFGLATAKSTAVGVAGKIKNKE